MDYPIVNQYKYLGTWLNQKLTVCTQLEHITKKADFIRHRLSPTPYNASLDFRRNLWQVFVLPLYEFISPVYHYEEAQSAREKVQLSLRRSFKDFTGLRKTVKTELINDLMAYNIQHRSRLLCYLSEQKWRYRERGEYYNPKYDRNLERPKPQPNIAKNQPKLMIKYINMQTALCPICSHSAKAAAFKTRCSPYHLEKVHNIRIDPISNIARKVMQLTKTQQHNRKMKNRVTRRQILKYAESLIEPNINCLKAFLNPKGTPRTINL